MWFIEFYLQKYFNKKNYQILLNLILVQFKNYIVSFSKKKATDNLSFWQNKFLNSLFCNFIFYFLKIFIIKFIKFKFFTHIFISHNCEYIKFAVKYSIESKFSAFNASEKVIYPYYYNFFFNLIFKPTTANFNLFSQYLYCANHANKFVLVFTGSKLRANKILQQIIYLLNINLHIFIKINHINLVHNSKGIKFFNYIIKTPRKRILPIWQLSNNNRINLNISIETLVSRYLYWGFFKKAHFGRNKEKIVARRVDKWIFLKTDWEVINRFNIILNGLKVYYFKSFCYNKLFWVIYLLKRSCALTLAHRHKLKSARKIFNQLGNNLILSSTSKNKIAFLLLFNNLQPGYLYLKLDSHAFNLNKVNVQSTTKIICSIFNCGYQAAYWSHIEKIKTKENYKDICNVFGHKIPFCVKHFTENYVG